MPIHLFIPMEPFMGTKKQWDAYFDVQSKANIGYQTYTETMSILGLFSIKKNKAHKEAIKEYVKSRDNYMKSFEKTDV